MATVAGGAFANESSYEIVEANTNVGWGRPPANSFCNVTPHSTDQLVNQVRSNPQVMDRYTRHFAMTSEEVVAMFRTLHPGRLSNDAMYTVYGVPRNGKLHYRRRVLKKGTGVFFDAQGRAILQMRCGNPLTLGPRNPIALSEGPEPAPSTPIARELEPEIGEAVAVAPPSIAVVPTTPGRIVPPVVTPPAKYISSRRSSGFGFFPLLIPIVYGATTIIAKGGGGGGKVVTPPPPVPEPASMAVMAIGIGALAARRRKKA